MERTTIGEHLGCIRSIIGGEFNSYDSNVLIIGFVVLYSRESASSLGDVLESS